MLALVLSQTPCPPGWSPLPNDACLLKGDAEGLIVYFHGMMAPSPKTLAWELGFIATASKTRHVPVIVMRGTPGLCDWATEYQDWWCWPSVRTRLPQVSTVLERVEGAVKAASQTLGRPVPAPLFVGYSNGGYFLTMVMGDTTQRASGFAIISAGLVKGVSFPAERKAPTLLVAAVDDLIQRPAMEAMRSTLETAGWSPTWYLRKGAHPPELDDFTRVLDFASKLTWR
jgi:poly(3-hydroxybutyrate) depolymerase